MSADELSDVLHGEDRALIAAWMLRRVVGKRPLQHSDQRKWVKFGVHRQAFSSESQFGLEFRQRFAKMAASEAANWESRSRRTS